MGLHRCEHPHCSDRAHGCGEDAERLGHLIDDIAKLSAASSFKSAARRFGDLRIELEREMLRLEEILLSPALPQGGANALALRAGHHHIRRALDDINDHLSRGESDEVSAALRALATLVAAHRELESRTLISAVVPSTHDR